MNAAGLRAMCLIANKLGWNGKPATEIISKIHQMVLNQQALELDTVGDCDDFEETLLSIAIWDFNKIISTLYVSDYQSLVEWQMHEKDLDSMEAFEQTLPNAAVAKIVLRDEFAEDYEWEDYQRKMEDEYYECMIREVHHYNLLRQRGLA